MEIPGSTSSKFSDGIRYSTYMGYWMPCMGYASNCCEIEITIRPKLFMESTFVGLSAQQTGDLFKTEDYSEVMNALPPDMVSTLQSGTVCLVFNYEDDDVINYIVGSTVPLTSSNLDFALQIHK